MNDDEFLDKFFNSTGDDLDNLIRYYINQKDGNSKTFDVDMVDIEKILNDDTPIESYTDSDFNTSNDYFKTIYEQLSNDSFEYPKSRKRSNRDEVVSLVVKSILIAIGFGLCLGVLFCLSQNFLETSSVIKDITNSGLYV
ncbi:MAG: hypothetical protein ACI4WH_02375 [Oscillospiraceae bacterium]